MTHKQCACSSRQSACKNKPGWFKPEQITPLAAALDMTEQELFDKHLAVDWWEMDDAPDIFVLAPALVGEPAGDMYPFAPGGVCSLFKDGKCIIHDKGKPFECAEYLHSDPPSVIGNRHAATAQAWNAPEHQAKVKELLGREPVAREWDIVDTF